MLEVKQLCGGYGKKIILNDITFTLNRGEVLGILGPNGSGKTTLLKVLLRILPIQNGSASINGKDLNSLKRTELTKLFSYIPQRDSVAFPYTVFEMVLMGRSAHINTFSTPSKEDIDITNTVLERLNIKHLSEKLYNRISGGERQLVLIARALCQDTAGLIMDEPTASLDYKNQRLIIDAIKAASESGKYVLFTTHSPAEPFLIADKVLLLKTGRPVGFGKSEEVLTSATLETVYGIPMDILTLKNRHDQDIKICMPIY